MAVLDERLILQVQLLQPLRPVVGECELLAADIESKARRWSSLPTMRCFTQLDRA